MFMRRVLASIVLMLLLSTTQAALVTQFRSFSLGGVGTQHNDTFKFDGFDTTLGILDEVRFDMQGTVTPLSAATSNLVQGPLGVRVPVPYDYRLRMDMDLSAIVGFDFDFDNNAKFNFSGSAPGIGGPLLLPPRQFSLSAKFDAASDLRGFDVPSTSGIDGDVPISSSRGDFEKKLLTSAGLQFFMLNTWSVVFENGQNATIVPGGNSSGSVTLSYKYSRFPEPPDPPSAVPVPAAVWLFGTALVGLIGFGRQRT